MEGVKDITLRTDHRHAPTRILKGLVEHMRPFAIDLYHLIAALAGDHRLTQRLKAAVGILERTGEDRLVEQLRTVRMDEIGAALTQQDSKGIGERLRGRDGIREPVETDVDGEGAYHLASCIVNGLAVGREDILHHDTLCGVFHIGFYPIRTVKQLGNQVPVHRVVLIMIAAFVLRLDTVTVVVGLGREIFTFLFIVEGLERDAAA